MKEAFDIMGSHLFLTVFLGALFIISLTTISAVLVELIRKISERKK